LQRLTCLRKTVRRLWMTGRNPSNKASTSLSNEGQWNDERWAEKELRRFMRRLGNSTGTRTGPVKFAVPANYIRTARGRRDPTQRRQWLPEPA
jgi:hypothetical protein